MLKNGLDSNKYLCYTRYNKECADTCPKGKQTTSVRKKIIAIDFSKCYTICVCAGMHESVNFFREVLLDEGL